MAAQTPFDAQTHGASARGVRTSEYTKAPTVGEGAVLTIPQCAHAALPSTAGLPLIGHGASANIYRSTIIHTRPNLDAAPGDATTVETRTPVVIKHARSLDATITNDIENEVRLLCTLSQRRHTHADDEADEQSVGLEYIIECFGTGLIAGRRFLTLECCDTTLEAFLAYAIKPDSTWFERIGGKPQMTLARAFRFSFELCSAVQYLHYHAIPHHCVLHRDLKPSNVGLTASGHVRLMDFGLARVVPRARTHAEHHTVVQARSDAEDDAVVHEATHTAAPLPMYDMTGLTGSLRYMAPEVARCTPYNETVDVYSLAIIMWETVSLERPFKQMNKQRFFEKVVRCNERPVVSPYWPVEFRLLLEACWHHDAQQRPLADGVMESMLRLVIEQRYNDATDGSSERFDLTAEASSSAFSLPSFLSSSRTSAAHRGNEDISP